MKSYLPVILLFLVSTIVLSAAALLIKYGFKILKAPKINPDLIINFFPKSTNSHVDGWIYFLFGLSIFLTFITFSFCGVLTYFLP